MTLEDLRKAALAGVPGARSTLVRNLRASLLRYFGARFDETDAEDLTHETIAVLLSQLGTVEPHYSLRRWIYGVARNKAAKRWHELRRPGLLEQEQELVQGRRPTGPSTWANKREEAAAVDDAIGKLKPEYRRAIEFEIEDGEPEAFAAAEQVAVATVRTRRWRAREDIRRQLAGRAASPPPRT